MENQEQDRSLQAAVEALVYVADEPVTVEQLAAALGGASHDAVRAALRALEEHYRSEEHGIEIREIAGGYKMFTKPEHHETVRRFVKELTPPLKLSMAALETLATVAYRQPITLPEIQQIRGVDATAAVKTLLDRKLVTTAGRKNVIGRPILYRTTKDFLKQFGLSGLDELPSIQEFEELARAALGDALLDLEPAPSSPAAPDAAEKTDGA
ncbi:MAG: SMC-Scp complex subunit ScpB [Terriglobia bacterium]